MTDPNTDSDCQTLHPFLILHGGSQNCRHSFERKQRIRNLKQTRGAPVTVLVRLKIWKVRFSSLRKWGDCYAP